LCFPGTASVAGLIGDPDTAPYMVAAASFSTGGGFIVDVAGRLAEPPGRIPEH